MVDGNDESFGIEVCGIGERNLFIFERRYLIKWVCKRSVFCKIFENCLCLFVCVVLGKGVDYVFDIVDWVIYDVCCCLMFFNFCFCYSGS